MIVLLYWVLLCTNTAVRYRTYRYSILHGCYCFFFTFPLCINTAYSTGTTGVPPRAAPSDRRYEKLPHLSLSLSLSHSAYTLGPGLRLHWPKAQKMAHPQKKQFLGALERGSVNRCFQVDFFSKAGCGKPGRERRPISTARGNMKDGSRVFSAA